MRLHRQWRFFFKKSHK